MKNFYTVFVFLFFSIALLAQTDGISYQAVILNPESQQLPGTDSSSSIFPDQDVTLRFTIITEDNFINYQEVHQTTTDAFGMVSVFIGQGEKTSGGAFNQINWDGTPRNLVVELDLYEGGNNFSQLSSQQLTYVPHSYHRDVVADGSLTVNGVALFKDKLVVAGELDLDDSLNIAGDTQIGGDAMISGDTHIDGSLTVERLTRLNNRLVVDNESPTFLTGRLTANGITSLGDRLSVALGASVGGSFNAGGNGSFGGALEVVGNQDIGGDVAIDGRLSAVRPVNFGNRLTVIGETSINNRLNVQSLANLNGNVVIAGICEVNNRLFVQEPGVFESSLDVNEKLKVFGDMDVLGVTKFSEDVFFDVTSDVVANSKFTVVGPTTLEGGLFVDNSSFTNLTGGLNVDKDAFFGANVIIDGSLTVNNLLLPTLNVSSDGTENGGNAAVFENTGEGADGIAIILDTPTLSSENRFISFYGQDDYLAGRIESFDAQTEVLNSLPSGIQNTSQLHLNQGIVYGSKGADYAEWLEKENVSEDFMVGEVVGVKGGKISRNTEAADHVLTISLAPIVLGNMPDETRKEAFEKVGFMGQVPALVMGKVNTGDFIVASGKNDGYAVAISEDNIRVKDLKRIIGKAWSASDETGVSLINVSVGLKSNEWANIIERQEERIKLLENKLDKMEVLSERLQKIEAKVNALDMN